MMTLREITNIISKQFGRIAQAVDEDYNVIVCPERIFVEDYLPREEEYVAKNSELPSLDSDTPMDLPYRKTIFVVIKVGSGQRNMAVSSSSVSIQCLSEENDFVIARQMLDAFISFYNFEYIDGLIQSYFNPETSSSQDAVYTGFRSLMSLRGNVRIPESGVAFVQDVCVSLDGDKWMKLPFINVSWQHNAQPDPQAFTDNEGYTLALNRQSTQTVVLNTYMWSYSSVDSIVDRYLKGIADGYKVDLFDKLDAYYRRNYSLHPPRKETLEELYPSAKKEFDGCFDDNFSVNLGLLKEKMANWARPIYPDSESERNDFANDMVTLSTFPSRYNTLKNRFNSTKEEITEDPLSHIDLFTEGLSQDDLLTLFSALCVEHPNHMNQKFRIALRTNISYSGAPEILDDKRMTIINDWFVLTSVNYSQQWGDISTWGLSFTRARKDD